MPEYFNPDYREYLEFNRLHGFDALWDYRADWYEEPNNRRGGWSGVGRLVLAAPDHEGGGFFLKRQQGHQRRTFRRPVKGEPTFRREFDMLRYLHEKGVNAPTPVYYGQQRRDGNVAAVLMTAELAGYLSFEDVSARIFDVGKIALKERKRLIKALAFFVRDLHAAGVQHRSLYPKHLFVQWPLGENPQFAVIDLEKSRWQKFAYKRTLNDLAALNRHLQHWGDSAKKYFFYQYLGVRRLSLWHKFLGLMILRRSARSSKSQQT